ncbi:MAG: hypothetical protein C4341_04290 [Armatimonadota bacterium]
MDQRRRGARHDRAGERAHAGRGVGEGIGRVARPVRRGRGIWFGGHPHGVRGCNHKARRRICYRRMGNAAVQTGLCVSIRRDVSRRIGCCGTRRLRLQRGRGRRDGSALAPVRRATAESQRGAGERYSLLKRSPRAQGARASSRAPEVLHLIGVFQHGGVERFVFDLVLALRAVGIESRVAALLARGSGPLEQAFAEQGVPVYRCHLRNRARLSEVLRQAAEGVAVVHSHLGVFSGDPFHLLRRFSDARLIAHEHTLVRFPLHKRWYEIVSHALTLRYGDAFAAVSKATSRRLMKGEVGARDARPPSDRVAPRHCVLLPPGIPLGEWPRRQHAPEGPPWRLLMVARLDPVKNHLFALQVARQLRDEGFDFLLDVVGDGPLRPRVEREISRLGLREVVRLQGLQDDVAPWMRDAHLLLLPSLSEGAPRVLMEAAAVGLPFLVSNRVDVNGLFAGNATVPLRAYEWAVAVKERMQAATPIEPLMDISIERAARDSAELYGFG